MKYDFQCTKCKNIEEKEISISDYDNLKNKQVCSKCGSSMVRIFKGDIGGTEYKCGGFYDTDKRGVKGR